MTDCAALVRYAYREALRPHTAGLGATDRASASCREFPDVRSGPAPGPHGWPLFRTAAGSDPRYAEFADARTLVTPQQPASSAATSRDARPGDLLYFRRHGVAQPDHLMVVVGRSAFDPGDDWVVYHTGPDGAWPGEVRKVPLADAATPSDADAGGRSPPTPRSSACSGWRCCDPRRVLAASLGAAPGACQLPRRGGPARRRRRPAGPGLLAVDQPGGHDQGARRRSG